MSTNNEELLHEILSLVQKQNEIEKKLDKILAMLEEIKHGQ